MMKKMYFCFLILVSLLCVSCVKHKYPKVLVEADSLCYTDPQAALKKLQTIRRGMDTTNTADWMYYRLVKLKAQDKAYIPHSDLANINQLIAYYESKGDQTLLPEAYYLAGSTYFDLHDSPQSLDYYHKTLDLISAKTNLRLWGITHAQIGYVLLYQGNYPSAIEHFRESYLVDSIRRDTVGMIYDLRDLSYSFSNMNKEDSTLYYSYKSFNIAVKFNQKNLVSSAQSSLANFYLDSKCKGLDSASKYVQPLLQNVTPENRSPAFAIAMEYYKLRNMPDSVKYYIKLVEEYGNVYARNKAYKEKMEQALMDHGSSTDRFIWQQFILYADSVNDITKTEAISKCQALYDYSQREKENERLKMESAKRLFELVILGLLITFLLFLFYVYYRRSRFVQKEQKRQMMELQHILDENAKSLQNHEVGLSKIKETGVYSVFLEKTKKSINLKSKEWQELDELIDEYFPDFKIKLYRISSLSDIEYHTCMLLKIGFPLSTIAEAIHRSPSALSMIRKRLYEKIFHKSGKPDNLDAFIRSL